MSANPFVTLEARVNSAVLRRLANAEATYQGGQPFGVIFNREPVDQLGIVESYQPTCGLMLSLVPGIAQGSAITVAGRSWTVVGGLEPDASGWATLHLREA